MADHMKRRDELLGDMPKKPGRKPGDGGKPPTPTRDRLNKAQAELAEVRAAKLRGELLAAVDVKATWSGLIADARQRLLAIPSRLGARLSLPRTTVAAMDEEIRAVLQALASGRGGGDG